MSKTISTPSVLAFERKLDPSDALFYAGKWEDLENHKAWLPVKVREKSVRGTISNRLESNKDKDPAKLDAQIEAPNLQTVDVASLPADRDTLKVTFTLRVLGGMGIPTACNNVEYRAKLRSIVSAYISNGSIKELAGRYAYNLANGRFLWRNRIGVEKALVRVELLQGGMAAETWDFDGLAFSLHSFDVDGKYAQALGQLAQRIEEGLNGVRQILLRVTCLVRVGEGQEVFPSQELILDRSSGGKSKTLYQVNDIAAIHSQKIGNAIRSIDTWYPTQANETREPIAVEPYGSVTTLGKAYRQPQDKVDFYTLLDDWLLKDKQPTLENQHFVMAVLVRGGVFGGKEKGSGKDKSEG